MSKEKKERYDSNVTPLVTPMGSSDETLINDYFCICPECPSSIEILLINENNNIIKFRCIEENKEYTMSIKDYLKKIKEKKEKNIEKLKDKCKIHYKSNECYCFDCNCHLCDECLKTRIHINHKKSNLIEIKPIDEELNIINKVIKYYKIKIEKLIVEQRNKNEEIEKKYKNEEENENINLKKEIEKNKIKEGNELKKNNNKYLNDIEEIRREYENKIKLKKKEYEEENNKIFNKYKLINEKEEIKMKIRIENIKENYSNEIKKLEYEKKIEDNNNLLKINEMISSIYNENKNNYYNAVNINKLLLYYCKSDYINENIIKKELNDKYENIIKIIKQKNNDDIKLNKIKEEEKKEMEELNKRIKKIEEENKQVKLENKTIIKEKENEIKELKKKINQNIFLFILYFKYIIF